MTIVSKDVYTIVSTIWLVWLIIYILYKSFGRDWLKQHREDIKEMKRRGMLK